MSEAEGIKTFFSSLAEGIRLSGQWRDIFDFMRDNLRALESKGAGQRSLKDLVMVGRVKAAADIMTEFGQWPDKGTMGYRERYEPRVNALFEAAMAVKPPKR